jgi:nitrogen fixation/metabolism regulation signal transduction histidine kinase
MTLFLFWTGILFAALAGFFIYLMKRRRIGFRFQTRITILMLLFSLAPAVPLIFFSIEIINQGVYQLGSKNIEDILNGSLEAIREPLLMQSSELLDRIESNPDTKSINQWTATEKLDYIFILRLQRETVAVDTLYKTKDKTINLPLFTKEAFAQYVALEITPTLDKDRGIFENYRVMNDSKVALVGVPVDKKTVEMVKKIERTAASYGMIYLLFIQGKLGYISAVVLIALLTAAVVIVAWRLSKSITGPIKLLADGFKKVGDGDLSIAVQARAKDEISFLLSSFNTMVAELKNTQQKLLQSERIAAWRDVARQISHEIKNPLTPIQLSLHRLRKKIIIPDEHTDAIEDSFNTIEEEIESLRRLASEFSEFARMPKPNKSQASVNATIHSAASLFENNTKNILIHFDLTEPLPDCLIDTEQMKRALINIITNALDATPENGKPIYIKSKLNQDRKVVEIQIVDNGAGMDSETVNRIFDPYFTKKPGGTGLGMPIAKRIIDEHSGTLFVESTPETGTTITIYLPI